MAAIKPGDAMPSSLVMRMRLWTLLNAVPHYGSAVLWSLSSSVISLLLSNPFFYYRDTLVWALLWQICAAWVIIALCCTLSEA